MSYEEDNPWVREIREGIDGVLASHARITYVHMNTKVDPQGGPTRGEEAAGVPLADRAGADDEHTRRGPFGMSRVAAKVVRSAGLT
jgi:hypothetical protein